MNIERTDKNEKKTADRDAKKDQKILSDMEAQETVLKLGAQYWQNLNLFISKKKINFFHQQTSLFFYYAKSREINVKHYFQMTNI